MCECKKNDKYEVCRRVRYNETNNPEDESEDQRSDWHQATRQPDYGGTHAVARLRLLLGRLDHIRPLIRTKLSCSGLLEYLVGGVQDHLQEREGHCEEHPDVNHLDVRGNGKALGESQETANYMVRKRINFG